MYVSSLGWQENSGDVPIFIHVSSHGTTTALSFGPDDIAWDKLTKYVIRLFRGIYSHEGYEGPIVLVISACGASEQTLTKSLTQAYKRKQIEHPPEYLFVFDDTTVDWRDAVVAWTVFYREAPRIDFRCDEDSEKVQDLLNRLKRAQLANLRYFRWDYGQRTYMNYPKRSPSR